MLKYTILIVRLSKKKEEDLYGSVTFVQDMGPRFMQIHCRIIDKILRGMAALIGRLRCFRDQDIHSIKIYTTCQGFDIIN
jgi:hypothetical protein